MTHPESQTHHRPASNGKTVAIVGSGPAGLTAAGELAKAGYAVTIFEAFHAPGGVLIYGIPEFRLPKDIVQSEVDRLVDAGVQIEPNSIIGKTFTLAELRERFDAMFVAVGAGLPVFMDVPGENFKGVYSANEYLTRVNLMGAWNADTNTPVLHGQRVVVVGGGNVAMDSVRTAQAARRGGGDDRLPPQRATSCRPAPRRSTTPRRRASVFEYLAAPVEVLGDEDRWVRGLRCIRMELGEPDASGRRRPEPIPGSEFEIECDIVVVAIGTRSQSAADRHDPGARRSTSGATSSTDEYGMTSMPGVFAGGDIVRGAATVILAMGDGKRAAQLDRRVPPRRVPAPAGGARDRREDREAEGGGRRRLRSRAAPQRGSGPPSPRSCRPPLPVCPAQQPPWPRSRDDREAGPERSHGEPIEVPALDERDRRLGEPAATATSSCRNPRRRRSARSYRPTRMSSIARR